MNNSLEFEVINRLCERIKQQSLGKDIEINYHVFGGMPDERLEKEFKIYGNGNFKVELNDALEPSSNRLTSGTLESFETMDMLKQISDNLSKFSSYTQTNFLPDSLIESITINVDNKKTKLYFSSDQQEASRARSIGGESTFDSLKHIKDIFYDFLEKREGGIQ